MEHSADTLEHEHDSENDEVNKGTDLNDNLPPKPSNTFQTKSSPEASDQSSPHSDTNKSTPSRIALTDPESFSNNCHNKPDDLDMELPPPIHEPSLIRKCTYPTLDGYITGIKLYVLRQPVYRVR